MPPSSSKRRGRGGDAGAAGAAGGLLEVVDCVSGVVRQLSVLPPKEPKIDLLEDDAKAATNPHAPARIIALAPIPSQTPGAQGEGGGRGGGGVCR